MMDICFELNLQGDPINLRNWLLSLEDFFYVIICLSMVFAPIFIRCICFFVIVVSLAKMAMLSCYVNTFSIHGEQKSIKLRFDQKKILRNWSTYIPKLSFHVTDISQSLKLKGMPINYDLLEKKIRPTRRKRDARTSSWSGYPTLRPSYRFTIMLWLLLFEEEYGP